MPGDEGAGACVHKAGTRRTSAQITSAPHTLQIALVGSTNIGQSPIGPWVLKMQVLALQDITAQRLFSHYSCHLPLFSRASGPGKSIKQTNKQKNASVSWFIGSALI